VVRKGVSIISSREAQKRLLIDEINRMLEQENSPLTPHHGGSLELLALHRYFMAIDDVLDSNDNKND
jgi:Fe-S cluster biogenesis protein NfuA